MKHLLPVCVVAVMALYGCGPAPSANADALSSSLPSIAISTPLANQSLSLGMITVRGTASKGQNNISRVEVKVDETSYVKATSLSNQYVTWSAVVNASAIGTHKLTARVTDSAGNKNWAEVTITIASAAPSVSALPNISITSPVPNQAFSAGSITVEGTASDGQTYPQLVEVKVDEGDYVTATALTPDYGTWSVSLNISIAGTYKLTARATDTDGNQNWADVSITVGTSGTGSGAGGNVYDDFQVGTYTLADGQNSPNGKWHDVYNGGGSQGVTTDSTGASVYFIRPKTATGTATNVTPGNGINYDTYSTLAITTQQWANFAGALDFRTVQQIRQNNPPNSWELGWTFLKYIDENHQIYFLLSTNGWELGKRDNLPGDTVADGSRQATLASGSSPFAVIGQQYHLDWQVIGNHYVVSINGTPVVDLLDDGTHGYYGGNGPEQVPHGQTSFLAGKGSLGLYCEDSLVHFKNVSITPQ